MVIFGGLELVAAGYLLHEHSKNKEERARLEEEEAALERRRRRRRRHSADRRRHHSHERKQSYSYEYEDARPSRPQYLAPPTYPAASPYLAPTAQPARATSAPPQQQQQRQDQYYPPTGWPTNWPQSQRPDPNVAPGPREAGPLPVKYGWRPDQEHIDTNAYSPAPSGRRSRGRSETRQPDSPAQMPAVYNQQPAASPHVRFALPSDRSDPPPAYSR